MPCCTSHVSTACAGAGEGQVPARCRDAVGVAVVVAAACGRRPRAAGAARWSAGRAKAGSTYCARPVPARPRSANVTASVEAARDQGAEPGLVGLVKHVHLVCSRLQQVGLPGGILQGNDTPVDQGRDAVEAGRQPRRTAPAPTIASTRAQPVPARRSLQRGYGGDRVRDGGPIRAASGIGPAADSAAVVVRLAQLASCRSCVAASSRSSRATAWSAARVRC